MLTLSRRVRAIRDRISLRTAILTVVALGLLAPAAIGGWINLNRTATEAYAEFAGDEQHLAKTLALGLAEPLWNLDQRELTGLLDSALLDPRVQTLIVTDADTGPAASATSGTSPTGVVHTISVPIVRDGSTLGSVMIQMDDGSVEARVQQDEITFIVTIVAQLVLSLALIFVLLHARFLAPLGRLARDSRRLADRALERPFVWTRHDELGALGRSLETARTSLVDAFAELEAKNAALEATNREVADLYNRAPVGYHSVDENTLIVAMNDTELAWLGYERDELVGKRRYAELLLDEYRADYYEAVARLKAGAAIRDREIEVRRRDGSVLPLLLNSTPVRDEEGRFLESRTTVWDLTDRRAADERERALQDQLRQAAKMEAVGQLAGGVAHDFNNLLTAISGYAELALLDLPGDAREARDDVAQVKRSADRAGSLTRQLLAFARRAVVEPKVVDPAAVLAEVAPMLRRLLGEHIELDVRIGPGVGRIRIDPAQLEQAILNLAVNARDAMPNGGRLAIELGNATLDETYVAQHPGTCEGTCVKLSIVDDGLGMDDGVLAHIFEPFFTTKEVGKGTGMGLATVFGIVQMAGGSIDVSSLPGAGSTFSLYFPILPDGTPIDDEGPELRPARGSETVLLVEDDAAVRRFAVRTLRELGYTVLEASDGRDAIRLVDESAAAIDVLVSDVLMPSMLGPELAAVFAQRRPDARILFVSGNADATTIHVAGVPTPVPCLAKPFRRAELSSAVRSVLESRAMMQP